MSVKVYSITEFEALPQREQKKLEREAARELRTGVTLDRCIRAEELMGVGLTLGEACGEASISPSTFRRYFGPARDLGLGRGRRGKTGYAA